jgi:hypothetical protein
MRATELVEEGFGTEPSEIAAIAADYRALDAEPTRRDLIWRYGIASEILDPIRRTTEIGNWLRTVVEHAYPAPDRRLDAQSRAAPDRIQIDRAIDSKLRGCDLARRPFRLRREGCVRARVRIPGEVARESAMMSPSIPI